jgi:hypothetical protein
MHKVQTGLMFICVVSFLTITACDSQDSESAELLSAYRGHVASAQQLVSDVRGGAGISDSEYHSQMNHHIDAMEQLREQMDDNCQQLNNCLSGNGATGHVENHHMRGGRMLSGDEMDGLHQHEVRFRNEMAQFDYHCLGEDAGIDDCDAYRPEHFDHMEDIMENHYEYCNTMMDDDRHMGDGRTGGGMGR